MKTFYLLLFSTTIILSCQKYNQEKELGKQIIGTWEIEHFYGAPNRTYSAGNGITISFSRGFVFQRKLHDTLTAKGIYSLETVKDCHPSDHDIRIKMIGTDEETYLYIYIQDGKLYMSIPNCYTDGGVSVWRRL